MSDRNMNHRAGNDPETTQAVYADPVAYLARFGIEAELVSETALSAAA